MVKRLHFVCRDDLNVQETEAETFVSGFWKLSAKAAVTAEFLALHQSRSEPSYRQGRLIARNLVDHELRKRYVFKVASSPEPVEWEGEGAGEKGYGY
jgi:hypothetical protein